MVCIHCGGKTGVTNSRHQKRHNRVWRRRVCGDCQAVFTTEETVAYQGAWLVQNKTGRLEPFSRDKLFLSLYRSCEHRETVLADVGALTDTIIDKLAVQVVNGGLDSRVISATAQVALNRFDDAASVSYQAYHV
jgi:transcriptional regulator NrdR family protein